MKYKTPELDKEISEAFNYALLMYPNVHTEKKDTKRMLKEISDVKKHLDKNKGKEVRRLLKK